MKFIPKSRHTEKLKDDELKETEHAFNIRMNLLRLEVGELHEDDPDSGVIFLSHLPHGFYGKQMWQFFTQFGRIKRLRMSMSKKTGKSRGFAYIEFEFAEVAKIAAETMNNYLMFNRLLKCCVVPKKDLHPEVFKNCYRKFHRPMGRKNSIRNHNSLLLGDSRRIRKSIMGLTKRESKTQKKLEAMGIDYKIKGFGEEWEEAKSKYAESVDDDENVTSSEEKEQTMIATRIEKTINEKSVDDNKSVIEKKRSRTPKSKEWKQRSIEKVAATDILSRKKEGSISKSPAGVIGKKNVDGVGRQKQKESLKRKKMKTPKKVNEESKVDEAATQKNTKRPSLTKTAENLKTPAVDSKAPKKRRKMNTATPAKRQESMTSIVSQSTGKKTSTKSRI